MSEKKNCKVRDYSQYDIMQTPELEEILRQFADDPQAQESDTETIRYVAEVLLKRENESNTGNEAQIAWESFEKDYLPIQEEYEESAAKPKKAARPWICRVASVAAVLVLVIGISATIVGAVGWEKVRNVVAKWGNGVFSFVSDSNEELAESVPRTAQDYTSLKAALEGNQQRSDIIPTRLPDGFALEEIVIDENPVQSVFIAYYRNNDKKLKVSVRSYLEGDPEKVEVGDDLVEMYEISGVAYYIFANNQQLLAVWGGDCYECTISGDLTLEEVKTMLNSIGKG